MSFNVRNLQKWYDYLQSKGVECLSRPERSPRGHSFFFCKDFDGNLIELMDLGHMYYVLGWLGPLGGWIFRRGMYKRYSRDNFQLPTSNYQNPKSNSSWIFGSWTLVVDAGHLTRNNLSWRFSAQRTLPSAPMITSSSCAIRTGWPFHSGTGVVACSSIEYHMLGITLASPRPGHAVLVVPQPDQRTGAVAVQANRVRVDACR